MAMKSKIKDKKAATLLADYHSRPTVPYSELKKLKPMTWVVVKWIDGPPDVVLFLGWDELRQKLQAYWDSPKGDIQFRAVYPGNNPENLFSTFGTMDQIVEILGPCEVPAYVLGLKERSK